MNFLSIRGNRSNGFVCSLRVSRWFFFLGGCVHKESVIILPRVGIIFSSFNIDKLQRNLDLSTGQSLVTNLHRLTICMNLGTV